MKNVLKRLIQLLNLFNNDIKISTSKIKDSIPDYRDLNDSLFDYFYTRDTKLYPRIASSLAHWCPFTFIAYFGTRRREREPHRSYALPYSPDDSRGVFTGVSAC